MRRFLGPKEVDIVPREIEICKSRLQPSVDQQKKYTQNCRRHLEFEVDQIFLKMIPMRRVMKFSKRGELSPRGVGPFEVIGHIGEKAYRLALFTSIGEVA